MAIPLQDLTRAAAIGAATGSRSTAGLAAVAWSSRNTAAKVAASLAAVTEAGLDKYPATPSRLEPQGLVPRLVLGAGTAATLARRGPGGGGTAAAAAVIGSLAALASAYAGFHLRAVAAERSGSDVPGALVEDALSGLLAFWGSRRR